MLKDKYNKTNKRGYTIVEFLVAMFVFTVVIIVVLGLLSVAIKWQRRTLAQQNIQENARYLLEFMAKEIRMSAITSSDGMSGNLSLVRSDGDSVTYSIYGNKIYRNSSPVSSDEVAVTGYFIIEGSEAGITDNQQPKVTISLEITGVGSRIEERPKINIQTTLSQRNLDL